MPTDSQLEPGVNGTRRRRLAAPLKPAGQLALLSYGSKSQHLRTVAAVTSFYANLRESRERHPALVYTDEPEFLRAYLQGLPVEYIPIEKDEPERLRDEFGYSYTIKVEIIERALQRSSGPVMFVDSDTFFTGDAAPLFRRVNGYRAFMHVAEYTFDSDVVNKLPETHPIRRFGEEMPGRVVTLSSGRSVSVSRGSYSWNSGAIVLHESHLKILPDVRELMRVFFVETGCHTAEQYAFSTILEHCGCLEPCDIVLVHYWDGVKKDIADLVLQRRVEDIWPQLSLTERLCSARSLTITLRQAFEHHALALKRDALQRFRAGRIRPALRVALRAIAKDPLDMEFLRAVLAYRQKISHAILRKTRAIVTAG